ncbi:hypothetical protein I317_07109 [Kwoniella heveanensis CBS 569]|nr:hypothetical protein I317_07109 [Kwoniella heveanensis CBS 569]
MASFFEMNEARQKALEERNAALQAELGVLKAEMADVMGATPGRAGIGGGMARSTNLFSGTELPDRAIARMAPHPRLRPLVGEPSRGSSVNQLVPTTPTGPGQTTSGASLDRDQSQTQPPDAASHAPLPRLAVSLQPLEPSGNFRPSPTAAGVSPYTPLPRASTNFTPTPTATSQSRHDVASEMGITERAAADLAHSHHHRSFVAPSFGSHQSYADWAFNRLYPQGQGQGQSHQPQDQTLTSLDEVISALRGVVIHLAAGLDTMERRNEVRTMTESLRVLEEVGSLRAIVTTMRMQVMMDRPIRPPPLSPRLEQPFAFSTTNLPPPASIPPYLNNHTTHVALGVPQTDMSNTSSARHDPSALSVSRTSSFAASLTDAGAEDIGTDDRIHPELEGDGEPVSEDSYLDPERPHSIQGGIGNIGMGIGAGGPAGSASRSSLVISVSSRNSRRGGRPKSERRIVGTIGSGAGLTGRTMGIPPPELHDHPNSGDNDNNDNDNGNDNDDHRDENNEDNNKNGRGDGQSNRNRATRDRIAQLRGTSTAGSTSSGGRTSNMYPVLGLSTWT